MELPKERTVAFPTSRASLFFQANAEAVPLAQADGDPNKVYPEKISAIVDQISALNLLEVADLNQV